ncbi:hypothetical protein RAS1_05080 [Phycisphaerae bacterium RAS1]|nr:hypothetical protein RAS1_05080 [Phycisphaerae bacterium RAS1]
MTLPRRLGWFAAGACAAAGLASTGLAAGGPIEVIYTKIPTHPSSIVPGAKDLAGMPALTNFRAMENLYLSPDGSLWAFSGRTQQGSELETIVLMGGGLTGTAFQQEGQPVPGGVAGELIDFFGSGVGRFNDVNHFAYSLRARGGSASTFQKVIYWNGTTSSIVMQMGDLYTGMVDLLPNPSGDETVGNSVGSIHPLNSGSFGSQDSTILQIHTSRRPAISYHHAKFQQTGVDSVPDLGAVLRQWTTLDANSFYTSPDGAHWVVLGEIATGMTTNNDVLVFDGATVLQESFAIPATTAIVSTIVVADVTSSGDWFARGALSPSGVYAVRNGAILAKTGDPITPSSTELWGSTFLALDCNNAGDWILVGTTNEADPARDTVMVLNGDTILARENDPIALDGDGMFDDNVFIGRGNNTLSAFEPNDTQLTDDLKVYFFANLRDNAGNDLNSNPAFGAPQAFLRIDKGIPCGLCADSNCDGLINILDINFFIAALNSQSAWEAEFGGGGPTCDFVCANDTNQDGDVNILDINDFIEALEVGKCRKCEVTAFNVPANRSGCVNNPLPSGNRRVGESFNMNADFQNNCDCCEYRQYVRGSFTYNGNNLPHTLCVGETLHAVNWQEDGVQDGATCRRYGHRDTTVIGDLGANDVYDMPNRATGCRYRGFDFPGLSEVPAGDTYDVNLEFRGEIIDTCNANRVVRTNTWTVRCMGTALSPAGATLTTVSQQASLTDREVIVTFMRPVTDQLVVVVSLGNALGDAPIYAADVTVSLTPAPIAVLSQPGAEFIETRLGGSTAHGVYTFEYPGGTPASTRVTVDYLGDRATFTVDLSQL